MKNKNYLVEYRQPLTKIQNWLILKAFFETATKFPFAVDLLIFSLTNNRSCRNIIEGNVCNTLDVKEIHTKKIIFPGYDLDQYKTWEREIYDLLNKPVMKCLPVTPCRSVVGFPLSIRGVSFAEDSPEGMDLIIEKIKNKHVIPWDGRISIIIEYYKLWDKFLVGEYGKPWFIMPRALYYNSLQYIASRNLQIKAVDVRNLYLYINIMDNGQDNLVGNTITCNIRKLDYTLWKGQENRGQIEDCVNILKGMYEEKIIDWKIETFQVVGNDITFHVERKARIRN